MNALGKLIVSLAVPLALVLVAFALLFAAHAAIKVVNASAHGIAVLEPLVAWDYFGSLAAAAIVFLLVLLGALLFLDINSRANSSDHIVYIDPNSTPSGSPRMEPRVATAELQCDFWNMPLVSLDGTDTVIQCGLDMRSTASSFLVERMALEIAGQRIEAQDWTSQEVDEIHSGGKARFVLPRGFPKGVHRVRLNAFAIGQWWASPQYEELTI